MLPIFSNNDLELIANALEVIEPDDRGNRERSDELSTIFYQAMKDADHEDDAGKVFAKVFQSDRHGQIIAMKKTDDDEGKPEVRFFVEPEGAGVCSIAIGYEDDDEGHERCISFFEALDPATAGQSIKPLTDLIVNIDK